jgi:thioredoxin 2
MQTVSIVCPHCHTANTVKLAVERKEVLCLSCAKPLNDTTPIECDDIIFKIHLVQNDIPVLVDFFSPDCGPCMQMAPDYDRAAKKFALEVRFIKINILDFPELASRYGINTLPTVVAFHKNVEMNRFCSALSKDQLCMWAESLIQMVL